MLKVRYIKVCYVMVLPWVPSLNNNMIRVRILKCTKYTFYVYPEHIIMF